MSGEILPTKESEVPAWLTNFTTVASANSTMLALPPNTVSDINNLNSLLLTQLNNAKATRDAARAAVVAKKATLRSIKTKITAANKNIQGNANVTPVVKKALGLNAGYALPKPVMPEVPQKLTVSLTDNGEGLLKWKSGGNKGGTVYEVFAKRGDDLDFAMIGSVGKTSFIDGGITPGVETFYQVRARRSSRFSAFSNFGVLYPASSNLNNTLVLHKAA